jgi:hypothetical protein
MTVDRQAKKLLMARLEQDAHQICVRFRLRYRVLEPERANVKRRYGVCFSDGTIRIRLIHATTKKPLKYSSLVNTLCHELAHLRHFNHGVGFQTFYGQILEWARHQGIYRPGPQRNSRSEGTRMGSPEIKRNRLPKPSATPPPPRTPPTPRTVRAQPTGQHPLFEAWPFPVSQTSARTTPGATTPRSTARPSSKTQPAAQLDLFR